MGTVRDNKKLVSLTPESRVQIPGVGCCRFLQTCWCGRFVQVYPSPATSTCRRKRPVCMSFTFEGHGDHYVKLSMLWCRGWTHPQQRQPAGGKASLYVIQPKRCRGWVRTTRVATLSSRSTIAARLELRVNYGDVLLSGVGSLTAGAITGVPMSPAHG
ncbi:hypothetical protein DAPPUDRAFT_111700 [Daphnia pulex]|uniref:Uncharacterized protein n=1 Tax=Daphnia pulex TaxID=6669 RepID=E9H9L1_DAPPU|nr:hypothetical protein DAPPUDRAFT_111700 [Daphnia pulex]|eukprot:EFX71496.1 hypothetical protein DAPPUDRAFT_111700 [Daphnia pulex]